MPKHSTTYAIERLPGELVFPRASSERMAPLFDRLMELGVVDREGTMIVNAKHYLGCDNKNWMIRIDWETP